jgi:hypothetical protein
LVGRGRIEFHHVWRGQAKQLDMPDVRVVVSWDIGEEVGGVH